MKTKKCNIQDLKIISGLFKIITMDYGELDELNIYKEDGWDVTLVVEDAKNERRILTYTKYGSRNDKTDGEYYCPLNGQQKPYSFIKLTNTLLLLIKGNEPKINQMYYLQPLESDFYGFAQCGIGFDMIGGNFRILPADQIEDIEFLTKDEKQKGYSLKREMK